MSKKQDDKKMITAVSPVITVKNGIAYVGPDGWRLDGSTVIVLVPTETAVSGQR